jgi:hypothetical protein
MFRIEQVGSERSPAGRRIVADPERDAWLQGVRNLGLERARAFKLVWGGRVIPFEAHQEHRDEGGASHYLTRILHFGHSAAASLRSGIPPYHFVDAAEEEAARMLAVEALLVFGSLYDGEAKPDGYYRVEHAARVYTRRDFGTA